MKQNSKRYIPYIALLCMTVVLLCGCTGRAEQDGPFTEVTGQPGDVIGTEKVECEEDVTLTSMPTPTSTPTQIPSPTIAPQPTELPTSTPTPTPVITDPHDGRFWTGNYEEETELLLTKAQIKEQNEKNYGAVGTKLTVLSEYTAYTAGEILGMIEEYSLPSRKYFDNREFGASEKETLLQERNLPELRENTAREIIPEYGILISNTDVRSFPTKKRLTSEMQGRFDYLQETRLLIGEPVLVLHRSKDGAWCFVQAENYCGWIRETAIAYCTKEELCAVADAMEDVENDRIVVVTKNGTYRIGEREIYLRMGTRLLGCDAAANFVSMSSIEDNAGPANGTVRVKLPCRDEEARLVWEEKIVSSMDASGEICFVNGYLPYTRKNIMQLVVRLLGAPYAWGDAPSFGADVADVGDNGMDCSSTVVAVFRCFGFVLARNTGTQRKMDCEKQEMSALGIEQRKDALDNLQGGELLYTSGHVMLYLGKVDGEYYVLHNTSTESRDDGGKDEFYRCVITTMRLGKTNQTILERLIQMNALFPID